MSSPISPPRLFLVTACWVFAVANTDLESRSNQLQPSGEVSDDTTRSASSVPLTAEFLQMANVFRRISAKQAKRPECNVKQACSSAEDREVCSTAVSSLALNVNQPPANDVQSDEFACRDVSLSSPVDLENGRLCFVQLRFELSHLLGWLHASRSATLPKGLFVSFNVSGVSETYWGLSRTSRLRSQRHQWIILDATTLVRSALRTGRTFNLSFRVCVKETNNSASEASFRSVLLDLQNGVETLTRLRMRTHGRNVASYPFAVFGQLGGKDPLDEVNSTAAVEAPERSKREALSKKLRVPRLGRRGPPAGAVQNATLQRNSSKQKKVCSVRPFLIDLRRDLGMKNVLLPYDQTFMANTCSGACGRKKLYVSTHARMKALIRKRGRNSVELDGNCCVATKWQSVSILLRTKEGFRSVWLDNSVVTQCACS